MKILIFVWSILSRIFRRNAVKSFVNEFVNPSIEIVSAVKRAVDSESVDVLVALSETNIDDKWQDRISDILAKAINKLYVIDDWAEVDPENKDRKLEMDQKEIAKRFIKEIKKLQPAAQSALLSKLGSTIVKNQSFKTKLKEFEADTLINLAYAFQKENTAS